MDYLNELSYFHLFIILTDKSDVEKMDSRRPTGLSHPFSSSLSDEVEGLSVVFSQANSDRQSDLGYQKSQRSENLVPSLPVDNNPASGSTSETNSQLTKPEKTVLLNATMEMTVSEDAEIVTVETKLKKKKNKDDCNSKIPRIQKKRCGSSVEVQQNEANTKSFLLTHQREEPSEEGLGPHLPPKPRRNIKVSHIPKLGNNQKVSENKSNSCDMVLVNVEDFFADSEVVPSKISERTSEEVEASSKVTLRRTRSKVRRQSVVIHKPLVFLSCNDDKSCQSGQELVNNEDEGDLGHPEQLEEFSCAEEVAHPVSGSADCQFPGSKMKTQSKPNRRTFVLSICRDSTSPGLDQGLDQGLEPPAETHCEMEEPFTVEGQCSESDPQTEIHSSLKRSRVETPEYATEVLRADQHAVLGSVIQEQKKDKKDETVRSSKKKVMALEEGHRPLKNKQKKKKTNRFISEQEVDEPPPSCTYETRTKQTLCSIKNQDTSKYHPRRKTSKPFTGTKNPGETFEKRDDVSLQGFDAREKAIHHNVGDPHMEDQPHWMLDIKTADPESISLPGPPSRTLVTEESIAVTTEASPGAVFGS